jgi:hypothetical protein
MVLTDDRVMTTDNAHADTESCNLKPPRSQDSDGRVQMRHATASDLAIGPWPAAPVAPERLALGVAGLHPRLFCAFRIGTTGTATPPRSTRT